jgi:hypothetical protein
MKRIYIERWENKEGDKEEHFYLNETKKEYLFGANPKYFPMDKVKVVLNELGYDF